MSALIIVRLQWRHLQPSASCKGGAVTMDDEYTVYQHTETKQWIVDELPGTHDTKEAAMTAARDNANECVWALLTDEAKAALTKALDPER